MKKNPSQRKEPPPTSFGRAQVPQGGSEMPFYALNGYRPYPSLEKGILHVVGLSKNYY